MNDTGLKEILIQHKLWLTGEGGKRANLQEANLRGINLWRADLQEANLRGINLREANLQEANLWGANLHEANLRGANLQGVNLWGANLQGVNLQEADLQGAVGNMREVKSIQLDTYTITYTYDRLQIGCKNYSIDEWFNFTDKEIADMDKDALEWGNKYKDVIKTIITLSPAEGN